MKRLALMLAIATLGCSAPDPVDEEACRKWQAVYVFLQDDVLKSQHLLDRPEGCEIP